MRIMVTYFNLKYRMLFHTLRERLLGHLRSLIQCGDYTERGLARELGVSQPHLHNVLAGVRALTVELADHVITKLEIPWADLWPEEKRDRKGRLS